VWKSLTRYLHKSPELVPFALAALPVKKKKKKKKTDGNFHLGVDVTLATTAVFLKITSFLDLLLFCFVIINKICKIVTKTN